MSLINKGFIKISNFKEQPQTTIYNYILTSKGIREKSLLTQKALFRKKSEYELLKKEIIKLERDAGYI